MKRKGLLRVWPSSSDGYVEGTADESADGIGGDCAVGDMLSAALIRRGSAVAPDACVRLAIDV